MPIQSILTIYSKNPIPTDLEIVCEMGVIVCEMVNATNWNLSYSHHIDLAGIPFIP